MRDEEGKVLRWYAACADIDDRKRDEERLQQENVALREEIDKASMFEEIVGTSPALQAVLSRVSKRRVCCFQAEGPYMLRTRRTGNGEVLFTFSGRIETENITQIQQLLAVETPERPLMFDLRDVTLVNQDAVTFLADCEAKGITLESCPLHIRNWINQEKRRNKNRRTLRKDTK